MVFVPTTFVEKVVPTTVVGTTVYTNSLKFGQITKPCQRFLRGNKQKIIFRVLKLKLLLSYVLRFNYLTINYFSNN